MAYEKYTVNQFRDAWFKGNRTVITDEEFKIVYSEYVDTSGLFLSDDFEKQGLIYNLNQRINYVKMFIRLQRDFIHEFRMPFIKDFQNLKHKYGYVLYWNNDIEDFEKQLQRVEQREIKNGSFMDLKIDELNRARKNKGISKEDEESLDDSRKGFIRMVNSLGKIGFKIDGNVSTVEELALMIKQQFEENEESKRAMNKHGR